MKKEIFSIGVMFVLMFVAFSGCLNESTVTGLAKRMEDAYNSIYDYRATVNYSTYNNYSREYIKTIKKPDKLRYEYLTPNYKEGDLDIINGNTQWRYDKSKNIAYQDTCNINIGEEALETPDFLTRLLFLMHNFNVKQLNDEVVGKFNTSVIEITPKSQTTFSKLKYWLDEITLFPIKWEIYDTDGSIRNTEVITSFEINVGVSDSEFELSEGVKILTPIDWAHPKTIKECEEAAGFTILFPTYLPEGYSLNEDYAVGSGGGTNLMANETIGTYAVDYFQNGIVRQVSDNIDTVRITYPRNDSYAEIIDRTTKEVLEVVYNNTGNFPRAWFGNIDFEATTYDITLQEALEDIFENDYLPKHNPVKVNINGTQGEYYIVEDTDNMGNIVYRRSCLSWNLEEYWLFLSAGGEAFLDSTEMIKIAESINTES